MNRPNIVYLNSHDTGRYIQPYGYNVPTPRLQQLAEEGVLFRKAFCAAPTCSPSRAALLTGMAPHNNGMFGLTHRGWGLNDYSKHLCNVLKANDYETALSATQHVAADPDVIGFDHVYRKENVEPEVGALEFINSKPDGPFYLEAGWGLTHRNSAGPDKEPGFNRLESPLGDPRYTAPPTNLPDTPVIRQDMADFAVAANRLDTAYGQVLDALEANGYLDNTIILVTTDHGIAFPASKCNLTDHGMGVLMIMKGPHGFTGGKVVDGMVSHIDVYPTLCEVLEIDKPDWLQGKSMMPLINGEVDEINEEVYSEVTYHSAYEPKRCVRTNRFKYIRRFHDYGKWISSNVDRSPSRVVWDDLGWCEMPREKEALYDLMFDPQEANNLAEQPQAQAVLQDMRQRLDSWMKRTNDPLLDGDVPAANPDRVDGQDWYSPNQPTRPEMPKG